MSVDPVCKMSIDDKETSLQHDFKGKTYYFCSDGCLERFRSSPDKFIVA